MLICVQICIMKHVEWGGVGGEEELRFINWLDRL